jgi:hypothetical protein
MRRFRGIPYMNEFRSVKQRDRRLEPPDFTRQSPAALRVGGAAATFTLRPAAVAARGLRYATAVSAGRHCIFLSRKISAAL